MPATDIARFFEELFRTGRASAGAHVPSLDPADPALPDLDRVLANRIDWHLRGLPGRVDLIPDAPTARACAHALFELLSLAIEPATERLQAAPAIVDAVPQALTPAAAGTLDALLLDAPKMRKRLEVASSPSKGLTELFDRLAAKSPMTLLRFCGGAFPPPPDLAGILGSAALAEEAVALLAFPGADPDRLRALGATLSSLLGAGGAQTHLALRAYEAFGFFCAQTPSREPAAGSRNRLDLRSLFRGGALGQDERAIAEYLRPLGVVAQSPRLDEVLSSHPRLKGDLLDAARAID